MMLKEKNSEFFGYGFPIQSHDEVKPIIHALKKTHFGAGYFCYDYQIGDEKIEFRTNDNGELNNTVRMPIFGQIQSFGLTNILIAFI